MNDGRRMSDLLISECDDHDGTNNVGWYVNEVMTYGGLNIGSDGISKMIEEWMECGWWLMG